MNKLQSIVNIVGEQQKLLLAPSTYDVRRSYLVNLVSHAEELGISEPCQELYDSYVARATTPDLRFQLEVADTGHFKWKLFNSRKVCCTEETLEELRQQYIAFLRTQNLENKTICLHDYSLRKLIEGLKVSNVSDFSTLKPGQIQSMLVFLSEKLSLNSRGTIFPIVRQIFSYLYAAGFTTTEFSGMVLTPACQSMHLRPYITTSDEKKLYHVMEDAPLRNKAMMRLALRLGLRDIDICNLRFSQIDWKNDQIILKQEIVANAFAFSSVVISR